MNNVCVLIPHFNNPKGLLKSVTSIGKDENIDIIVVDDGSYVIFDESQVQNSYSGNGNVKFIYLPTNEGIENALNKGVDYAILNKYKYVARLDCDDLCHTQRFKIQLEFMEKNMTYGLIGSWCEAIDINGGFLFEMKFPITNEKIRKRMHLACMFIHPTLFIRAEALNKVGGYSNIYKAAEDYDLCFRIMNEYKVANIPIKLLKFEYTDSKGISSQKRQIQMNSKLKILKKHFYFGWYPVLGIIKSIIMYYMPRSVISFVKIKFGQGV